MLRQTLMAEIQTPNQNPVPLADQMAAQTAADQTTTQTAADQTAAQAPTSTHSNLQIPESTLLKERSVSYTPNMDVLMGLNFSEESLSIYKVGVCPDPLYHVRERADMYKMKKTVYVNEKNEFTCDQPVNAEYIRLFKEITDHFSKNRKECVFGSYYYFLGLRFKSNYLIEFVYMPTTPMVGDPDGLYGIEINIEQFDSELSYKRSLKGTLQRLASDTVVGLSQYVPSIDYTSASSWFAYGLGGVVAGSVIGMKYMNR